MPLNFASQMPKLVIYLCSTQIGRLDLPVHVQPARAAETYHRVDVVDNGIGFEQKYVDRIFQVFQLHGK